MTNQTKRFINNFSFEEPSWENVPENFPHCKKYNLTTEEGHLLDAIILAWLTETNPGQHTIYKRSLRTSLVAIAILFISLITIAKINNPESIKARSVNAATVSATLKQFTDLESLKEVVESTMSAARRAITH